MQKTLKKILDELNKPTPRLDYIKGMLEVLIEDGNEPQHSPYGPLQGLVPPGTMTVPMRPFIGDATVIASGTPQSFDEASILDATASAKLESIKTLAEASLE